MTTNRIPGLHSVCIVSGFAAAILALIGMNIGDRGLLAFAWILALVCTLTFIGIRERALHALQAMCALTATIALSIREDNLMGMTAFLAAPFALALLWNGCAALVRVRLPFNWLPVGWGILLGTVVLAAGGFATYGAWVGDDAALSGAWALGLAGATGGVILFEVLIRFAGGMFPYLSDLIIVLLGGVALFAIGATGAVVTVFAATSWWMLLSVPYVAFVPLGVRAVKCTIAS